MAVHPPPPPPTGGNVRQPPGSGSGSGRDRDNSEWVSRTLQQVAQSYDGVFSDVVSGSNVAITRDDQPSVVLISGYVHTNDEIEWDEYAPHERSLDAVYERVERGERIAVRRSAGADKIYMVPIGVLAPVGATLEEIKRWLDANVARSGGGDGSKDRDDRELKMVTLTEAAQAREQVFADVLLGSNVVMTRDDRPEVVLTSGYVHTNDEIDWDEFARDEQFAGAAYERVARGELLAVRRSTGTQKIYMVPIGLVAPVGATREDIDAWLAEKIEWYVGRSTTSAVESEHEIQLRL